MVDEKKVCCKGCGRTDLTPGCLVCDSDAIKKMTAKLGGKPGLLTLASARIAAAKESARLDAADAKYDAEREAEDDEREV